MLGSLQRSSLLSYEGMRKGHERRMDKIRIGKVGVFDECRCECGCM